jgi:hypothetical protein
MIPQMISLPLSSRRAFLLGAGNSTAPLLARGCTQGTRRLPPCLSARVFEFSGFATVTSELSFCNAVPLPPVGDGADMVVGVAHRRERRIDAACKNWGTKWDAGEVELCFAGDYAELVYSFDAAWKHPDAWLRAAPPLCL